MIIDTHAHYDDEAFDKDREKLLDSMQNRGIEYIVNVGASIASCKTTVGLTRRFPNVYGALGVHPDEVASLTDEDFDWLKHAIYKPKIVAVGEIGLDYHWNDNRDEQIAWFEKQMELAREAEKAGADGVLAVAPYFSVYSEENVEAYYRKLAEQVRLPILIYNFPALTGFDMNPEMVNRLAQQCPNIMGIKDTVPENEHLKEMLFIKKSRPEFSVFCAYESQALEMIKGGVDGFVNATANFAPQFTAQLLKAAREDDSKSMELAFEKMKEASEVYQYSTPLLLAVKEAVYQKVLGKRGYEILPGLPVKEVYRKEIEKILSNL